ncbi:hypothetical protein [Kitasatospora phosalacinea]|uniref:Uncharacterized protein n=1 Tax=Kitasatospora phosalacinea TaxID=2065 RepID=A0A9W6PJR0_9ACTN|nr:hypothetical protein [Kitasatospora phosalacinea]GLW56331.1 hypothetical protein Kpho01_43420 [Kitasatospora phosalacinea]
MNARTRPTASRPTAIYLRCHPHDAGLLLDFWGVLSRYALDAGLGEATVFMDNGRDPHDPLTALDSLLAAAAAGHVSAVVIPGPFVFSPDDEKARATALRFEAAGCAVHELPAPRARSGRTSAHSR